MTARVVPGVVLIAVGALFFLDALGVIDDPAGILRDWWPLTFVLIGASIAVEQRRLGAGPWLFFGLAALLLLITSDLADARVVWPVALIIAGGWLLLGSRLLPGRARIEGSAIDVTSVFGDRHVRGGAGPLERLSLTSVFGDLDVDLTDTPPGANMQADLAVLFGDVDLAVPPDWRVSLTPTSVFGDLKHIRAAEAPADDGPLLRLRGVTVFGDITVRQ